MLFRSHHTFSRSRIVALHDALTSAGLPSEYDSWLDGWDESDDTFARGTTRVECAEFFQTRDMALRAHATQIDPASGWFAVPHDMGARVWPTEDYELACSRIGPIAAESDLFEGLRV